MTTPKSKHLPKNHNLYTRDLKNFDMEHFFLDLISINWDDIVDENNVNKSFKYLLPDNILSCHPLPLPDRLTILNNKIPFFSLIQKTFQTITLACCFTRVVASLCPLMGITLNVNSLIADGHMLCMLK